MENPYKAALNLHFNRLISLRHNVYWINMQLLNSIAKYAELDDNQLILGSSLVISDITGPTDKGWTINFYTGHKNVTMAEEYEKESQRLMSIESCYAFAQSFEGLERFFKDIVWQKTQICPSFFDEIKDIEKDGKKSGFIENVRLKYPGGDKLFGFVKKATGKDFLSSSQTNNYNLSFSEFWCVLSIVRHAITHSQSIIRKALVFKSLTHKLIFNHFFIYHECDQNNIEIRLNYDKLEKLIKSIAEFSFQIFKILSIQKDYDWAMNNNNVMR
jgi:hypothetical protein